jgi:hypothetical protein
VDSYGRFGSAFDAFRLLVPEYKSKSYGAMEFEIPYNQADAKAMAQISQKRADSRIYGYISPVEMQRVKDKLASGSKRGVSIRFGNKKEGRGLHAERGDFCMVGGVLQGRKLTVFYRSLDLIGGFLYDLVVFDHVIQFLEPRVSTIHIITLRANVQAMKGNSNEILFKKMGVIRWNE